MNTKNIESIPFEGILDEKHYFFACDLTCDVSRWSKNAVELFGLPDEYMENAAEIWLEHIHPADKQRYSEDLDALFSGKKAQHNIDYRARTNDGQYISVTCKGKIIDNAAKDGKLFVGFIENHAISSHIDSITGLHNFYSFINDIDQLNEEISPLSFLLIGINRFSDINNTYGYTLGNKLLGELANDLVTQEHTNFIYRLDGTKFCLILNTNDNDKIEEVFNNIKKIAHKGYIIDNMNISFTISGSSLVSSEYHDAYSIQTALFASLAESKKKKHSQLVFFDNKYVGTIEKNIALLETLRNCVYNNCEGFYMCYQPIVEVETNTICGTEALLRWSNDDFGNIPPGIFIPLLENDPCFYQLGNWILYTALEETKQIIDRYPNFIVHVNVSSEQIEVPSFRESVRKILLETGFPPANLCIELTERVVALNLDFLNEELSYFKSLGIKISLDDFGTGVNSLNLLLSLPVDEVKIERVFVKDILENSAQQTIVKTISLCANELGLDVCVEGVETEEMRDYLKRYEINQHQGYYYSKPIIIGEFISLVT